MKKLITALLTVMMAFSCALVVSASKGGTVYVKDKCNFEYGIDSGCYTSFEEAYNNVPDGGTLVLYKSVTLEDTFNIEKEMTLNIHDHYIKANNGINVSNTSFTIIGSGNIYTSDTEDKLTKYAKEGIEVSFNEGTYNFSDCTNGCGATGPEDGWPSSMIMVDIPSDSPYYDYKSIQDFINSVDGQTAVISIKGEVTEDITIPNDKYVVLDINGGVLKGSITNNGHIHMGNGYSQAPDGVYDVTITNNNDLKVYGGVYTQDVTQYLYNEYYKVTQSGNLYYVDFSDDVVIDPLYTVGEEGFDNINDASSYASESGETIILTREFTNDDYPTSQTEATCLPGVTVDLNGYNLSQIAFIDGEYNVINSKENDVSIDYFYCFTKDGKTSDVKLGDNIKIGKQNIVFYKGIEKITVSSYTNVENIVENMDIYGVDGIYGNITINYDPSEHIPDGYEVAYLNGQYTIFKSGEKVLTTPSEPTPAISNDVATSISEITDAEAGFDENNIKAIDASIEEATDISSDDKDTILEKVSKDETVFKYLDLTLVATDTSDKTANITELNSNTTITILLDDATNNSLKGKNVKVIRLHDGIATVLSGTKYDQDKKTITISTDKFSIYTIVISDKKDDGNKNTSSNTSNQGSHVSCEEYNKSNNWTWSESQGKCVYRVSNTSAK